MNELPSPKALSEASPKAMVDSFGRHITYVRLSVTDRCNFRCTYCMPEKMNFLPKAEVLTIEEMAALAGAFVAHGVKRLRLTGGEPLVRKGFDQLLVQLAPLLGQGLDELTLTTNGSRLAHFAPLLRDAGVRRVNVSLDTLIPERFSAITRRGNIAEVLGGIRVAQKLGLQIKLNMVALKGTNEDEIIPMMRWAAGEGLALTLIETMPLGLVEEDRTAHFLPLNKVRRRLEEQFTLTELPERTGGPATYYEVAELGLKLGLITPLTHNFCESCNRIRVTATGTLYMCLGQADRVELRDILRHGTPADLDAAFRYAMEHKPKGHDFNIARRAPALPRHMSVTGG